MAGSSMYLFWKTIEDMFQLLQTFFVFAKLVFGIFKILRFACSKLFLKNSMKLHNRHHVTTIAVFSM
jgi:hypothetical protein